jgi:hypothetical protein
MPLLRVFADFSACRQVTVHRVLEIGAQFGDAFALKCNAIPNAVNAANEIIILGKKLNRRFD